MNKKIIVTGCNGFIGPLLINLLLEKGYEVLGIDINYFDESCNFYAPDYKNITVLKKDMRNIEAKDLEGAYAICHLAALSNDPMGELDEQLTFDINHLASVRIAKLAKEVGVKKFIYSSSCSSYGVAGDEAIDETAALNPVTAYAKSKVFSERDIMPLGDENFCVTFLRNATAYGISPKLRVDLVVNNLVGWAVTQKKIKIMSDGSPWRPLVHAQDIGRAFVAMVEADASIINKQAYNVGANSENYRVREVAALVKEVMPDCEVVITGEHGGDSRTYRVNFDKIYRDVPGFQPKWTLKEGIRDIYEKYSALGLSSNDFDSKKYIRLKQLLYLIDTHAVDSKLNVKG